MNFFARHWNSIAPDLFCSSLDTHLFKKFTPAKQVKSPVVAVQCIDDYFYFVLWGIMIKILNRHQPYSVHQIVISEIKWGESANSLAWLYARLATTRALDRKWIALFSAFCQKVAYRNAGFLDAICHFWELIWAIRLYRTLRQPEDLVALHARNVWIGDLIYDTYLRFKPSPTIKLDDGYLVILIWRSLKYVRKSRRYFKKAKPSYFFTSYTTYIQHGIAARVAINEGVPVYAFGNIYELYKPIIKDSLYHSKDTSRYREIFATLSDPEQKRQEAEKALQTRLSGGVDFSTSYMRKSAYGHAQVSLPDLTDTVVIFLHDFFDSPHIYGWMLYSDFWIWICQTIEVLVENKIPFVLKPHPNQIATSQKVLGDLQLRYPQVRVISAYASNVQLTNAGISLGVTVYGTVAHEMAYLGVPVISCGDNPHKDYSFCRIPKTQEEYRDLLINHATLKPDKAQMRQEALEFYFMHNLYGNPAEKALRELAMQLRKDEAWQKGEELESKIADFEKKLVESGLINEFIGKTREHAS